MEYSEYSMETGTTERRRTRPAGPSTGLFAIGIAGLFLAGFLMLVVLGAHSYRGTVSGQMGNGDRRAQLSYLATIVKANDLRDAVSVSQDGRYGTVLTLEDGWGYATRLYVNEGQLTEDYAAVDSPLDPEEGQVIGATRRFDVTHQGDLLRIALDEGEVVLRLRSGEVRP